MNINATLIAEIVEWMSIRMCSSTPGHLKLELEREFAALVHRKGEIDANLFKIDTKIHLCRLLEDADGSSEFPANKIAPTDRKTPWLTIV